MAETQVVEPPRAGIRSRVLAVIGLALVVAGAAAIALTLVLGNAQYADAVANLQRAPAGCETDFEFTGVGKFTFYVETKGRIGELRGDCAGADQNYSRKAGAKLPQVSLSLIDASGAEVALERSTTGGYDVDGYVGTAKRTVELGEPGKYTLSVTSDETDFVISVGRDPQDDHDQQQLLGVAGGIAGMVLGGIMAGAGLRRRRFVPPVPPPVWPMVGATRPPPREPISWAPPVVEPTPEPTADA